MNVTTIGLDQAKSVFQAHGVDEAGRTVLVKKLHRKQMLPFVSRLRPCLIGIEACAIAIRPPPLTRGLPPSPSGSLLPRSQEKS